MLTIDEKTTYFDTFMKYGLFFAGIFQLMCILALIFVPTSYLRKMEKEREENVAAGLNNENKNNLPSGKQKKQTDKVRKRK